MEAGDYVLKVMTSAKEHAEDMSPLVCAHVMFSVEMTLQDYSKRKGLRQELIELPDLMAVQPFPEHLNEIGMFDRRLRTVTTATYKFYDPSAEGDIHGGYLYVTEPTIFRIASEPADLTETKAKFQVKNLGTSEVISSDEKSLLDTFMILNKGKYKVDFHSEAPFLVTLGFHTVTMANDELAAQTDCTTTMQQLPHIDFDKDSWRLRIIDDPTINSVKRKSITE